MSGNRVCISRNLSPTALHRVCSLDVHGVSRPLHGTAMQTTLYTLSTARATPMTPNTVLHLVSHLVERDLLVCGYGRRHLGGLRSQASNGPLRDRGSERIPRSPEGSGT